MSVQNIIDDTTGKIATTYLPATHQNGITQITTGTPNDIILTTPSANVVNINFSQEPTVQTINATLLIRLGDQAQEINDEVIIDQSGITVRNGDLTIENGADSAILQAGTGDRLLVNAGTVAYTSEIPTVALTAGANVSVVNNSSGVNYSFQVSATGEVGVQSVSSTDPNIVIAGTAENPTLALANDLYINDTVEAMNGIFTNSINISGEAIIQAGIDLSANGSECVLFTFNNALTVNEEQVALLSDIPAIPPNTSITAGTNISVSNPSTNTFTINNTLPATSITAGTGVSVSNPSTNTFTVANSGVIQLTAGAGTSVSASTGNITVANTGVLAVNAGTGIQVSGLQSSRQVAIANIGTAGTYAYPTSITTNAQGQVSAVSAGSAPVASVSGSGNITVSGTATAPVVNLANAVNITGGNSFNFNPGATLSVNTPITTNIPGTNATNLITFQVPLVSDGTQGPLAGVEIQTAPGSATNGNVGLTLTAPDDTFYFTMYAPASSGTTGGTTGGQMNLWGYPTSVDSPFFHSFNPNQAYCNLQVAPDGSEVVVGNVIGGNSFTQTANTGCELKVAGTNSSGTGIVYGRVYDDTFYPPPGATPPTINSGTGISVANPSANTYTITNTAPYTAPTSTTQNGGNYTIQLSDLGDTVLFDAPANNQSYTITLPTILSGATAGQTVNLGRSPLDNSLGTTYTIQTGIITLGTLGTSNPTSSVLQFIISSASGGSLVWELVGQRLLAGSNISLTGTTDYTTINCTLPQTSITGGININIENPSTNTFTVDCTLPATSLTAGNNTSITANSTNNFTIGSSVPAFSHGTSSSSVYLYNNTNFGSQNVSIPLTSLTTQTGLYMFQVCVFSGGTTSPLIPYQNGGVISAYLQGTPASGVFNASILNFNTYELANGLPTTCTKVFYQKMNAGQQYNLNIQPFDGSRINDFSIWNIGVQINAIYLGAMSN